MADASLLRVIETLQAMPAARRNALLSLIDFFNDLPKEELAIVAKATQPQLTDEVVAGLCGVSIRTLYRWERFQRWKMTAEDYWESKQRQWTEPDDHAA
jgi:predicted metal-dependent hydrolase